MNNHGREKESAEKSRAGFAGKPAKKQEIISWTFISGDESFQQISKIIDFFCGKSVNIPLVVLKLFYVPVLTYLYEFYMARDTLDKLTRVFVFLVNMCEWA